MPHNLQCSGQKNSSTLDVKKQNVYRAFQYLFPFISTTSPKLVPIKRCPAARVRFSVIACSIIFRRVAIAAGLSISNPAHQSGSVICAREWITSPVTIAFSPSDSTKVIGVLGYDQVSKVYVIHLKLCIRHLINQQDFVA